MTEFKPNDQPGPSTSSTGQKKKGGPKRRTKRDDLSTVSTASDNATITISPTNTRVGTDSLPQDPGSSDQKPWPRLVRSLIYNPDYPTFCECLQPSCPNQSPTARAILFRGYTTYCWPGPGVTGYGDWPSSIEQAGAREGFIEGPNARKYFQLPTRSC